MAFDPSDPFSASGFDAKPSTQAAPAAPASSPPPATQPSAPAAPKWDATDPFAASGYPDQAPPGATVPQFDKPRPEAPPDKGYFGPDGSYVPPQARPTAAQAAETPPNPFWTSPQGRETVASIPYVGPGLAFAGDVVGGAMQLGGAATGAVQEGVRRGVGLIDPQLGRDVAALPEAFPLGGAELGGFNPAGPSTYTGARAGATRGTFQPPWSASKPPPVTLGELTGAIERAPPPAAAPPPGGAAGAAPPPEAPKPGPGETAYTTKVGSTYIDHGDGTSTRTNRVPHPGDPPGATTGPQPRSDRTVYIRPEDLTKWDLIQTQGGGADMEIAPRGTGEWGIRYTSGPDAGKFEARTLITPSHEPAVGLHPVELWDGKTPHFGNEITDVQRPGDTAAPPGGAAPDAAPPPGTPPATAAEARGIATKWYTEAERRGGMLTPQFVNKFIDYLQNNFPPKTEAGTIFGEGDPITALVQKAQALRDKPMSLRAVQEMDESLSQRISADYQANKRQTDYGRQLLDMQHTMRNMIDDAKAGDVIGGPGGFDALKNARKAYSQAMKMGDIERMEERANWTNDADGSFKTQAKNLLTGPRSRGYNTAEREAVTLATDPGKRGMALKALGSKLAPWAAGLAASALIPHWVPAPFAEVAVGLGTHQLGQLARRRLDVARTARIAKAKGVLAGTVPGPPPTPAPPP